MNKIIYDLKRLNSETNGQGASEYILLFGGVVVIAIAALLIYRNYFQTSTLSSTADVDQLRSNLTSRGQMKLINENNAQLSAELILLIGAMIMMIIIVGVIMFQIYEDINISLDRLIENARNNTLLNI